MEKWPLIHFEALYDDKSRNGINRPKSTRGIGFKMVNMGELFKYDRIDNQSMELVLLNEKELVDCTLKKGDLLFARQSLVAAGAGKCSIILNAIESTTFESHLIRVRLNKKQAAPLFYYYYFKSHLGKSSIQSLVMQVSAAGIRGSELAQLFVPLPPLPIQRKIAAILSAYDDLIENNTRRIALLEQIAQAIYREWFFEYRYPGHEDVPLVESALGMVPQGWEVVKLGEIVTTQYGYTESSNESEIGPKFLRGMDINKQSYIDWDSVPYCPISEEDKKKYLLSVGDILVIRMADPGKVGIVERDIDSVFASYLIRLRIDTPIINYYYLFYALLSERYQQYVSGASTGTTRKSASAGVITDIDMIIPQQHILLRFEKEIYTLRKQLNNMISQNTTLRRTRDLLLPKLISGEVDVSGIEIAGAEDGLV